MKTVNIPIKWLNELIALCGPEDHELRERVMVFAAPQAQADARDAIRELIAKHRAELEHNDYAYFELAYTRRTGWMAWITDKPLNGGPVINPDRKVLARGQGDTPEEACADAIAAQAAQQGDAA